MPEKKNQLWRLDVLEAHFLEKPVRFQRTKALLRVKGKSKVNLLPEDKEKALQEIEAIKSDVFAKKLHSALVKYSRAVKKVIKTLVATKRTKDEEKKFLESLNVEHISSIRIIKLTSTIFKLNAKKLLNEPETKPGFIPAWMIDAVVDKYAQFNPSRFYNEMTNEQRNWYSKLMNHKDIQQIVDVIENSFKIVLGPVKKEGQQKDIEDGSDESESESESEEEDDEESDDDSGSEEEEKDFEVDEDAFAEYDKYLAYTDDEEDEVVNLDPTIDYNEVTDDEPSDDEEREGSAEEVDEFFDFGTEEKASKKDKNEKKEKKEKKSKEDKKKDKKTKQLAALPELQGGYISASEDSDVEDDEVVQEITGAKKKNRRGQRARQAIWEQKFGRGANHVKKDKEAKQALREQKQKEYEERAAKRAAKVAEMTGSNASSLGARKSGGVGVKLDDNEVKSQLHALHPSWEAKKKQDAALKNTKFQGKKVVF